jgi:hypothetical protein
MITNAKQIRTSHASALVINSWQRRDSCRLQSPYTYMPTARVPKTIAIFFSMFHACLFCCSKNEPMQKEQIKPSLAPIALVIHSGLQFCNSCKLQIWQIHAIYNLQFGDPCTNQQEFPNQKSKIKTTKKIMFQICMYCCSKSDHQCRRR